ncbi:hypothetical protein Btru_071019 [Bulinus truncatus]|nr:hypothetical protein Btru_071019 [Bulinus truncatus]
MRVLVNDKITTPLVITMFVGITDINDNTPTISGLPRPSPSPRTSPVGTRLARLPASGQRLQAAGTAYPALKSKTCSSYNVIRDVHETINGVSTFNLSCTDLESRVLLTTQSSLECVSKINMFLYVDMQGCFVNRSRFFRMNETDTKTSLTQGLQVNSASGAVILNGVLDYENNDRKLEIKVQVSDFGFPIVLNSCDLCSRGH